MEGETPSKDIQLICEKGHQFTIQFGRKLQTLCCQECRKDERERVREELRRAEEKRNEENRKL